MASYKKIIFGVDGGEAGFNALIQGLKLADETAQCTAAVVVPSVFFTDTNPFVVSPVEPAKRMEEINEPFRQILDEAEKRAEDAAFPVNSAMLYGEVHERIIDLADSEDADLIVLGRKEKNDPKVRWLGSAIARVVGYGHCETLIVPHDSDISFETVMVATDGSEFGEAAVNRAIDLAEEYGGELVIFSAIDIGAAEAAITVPTTGGVTAPHAGAAYSLPDDFVEGLTKRAEHFANKAKEAAEKRKVSCRSIIKKGDAYEKILEAAEENLAGLIVMGTHGRTGLRRLLMGSVTEKVLESTGIPVLTLKPENIS